MFGNGRPVGFAAAWLAPVANGGYSAVHLHTFCMNEDMGDGREHPRDNFRLKDSGNSPRAFSGGFYIYLSSSAAMIFFLLFIGRRFFPFLVFFMRLYGSGRCHVGA